MRAMEPHTTGYVDRAGVQIYYEVFGDGAPTLLLVPPWQLVHSRMWKAQVPYLARHYRVVTFDVRGNGRSDRPAGADCYTTEEILGDTLAVLAATGTERAVVVGFSLSGWWTSVLAAEHPDRVDGLLLVAPVCPLAPWPQFATVAEHRPADDDEYARINQHEIRRDYRGFVEWLFPRMVIGEPHSTKQIEDSIGWALETTGETAVDTVFGAMDGYWAQAAEVYAGVRAPSLVVHGTHDELVPFDHGATVAERIGAELVTIEGAGHQPMGRDPVKFNLLVRQFVDRVCPPPPARTTWTRALNRPKRALFCSSPVGLGHIMRDVAIADELRKLHPGLQIDWLDPHPVTRVLAARNERIHPASKFLASKTAHFDSESAEHDLHCFQAIRTMDEILVANFMVFDDVLREEPYDLVVGDELWEIDYYLHENPELKRCEFAWLTDFVGWLPFPDGGEREAYVAADYNEEMIEHVARFPRLRSKSVFIGEPDDLVADLLGPNLPSVRDWTTANFEFSGYVTGFDQTGDLDREAIRAELGWRPDEKVCIATVGGTGVGTHLLRRVIAAHPYAKKLIPDLRMIVVTGPRIHPDSLPAEDGLEVLPYVHGLYRHLAACDIAIVQGGLTTAMELTAYRRPFLYFPLRHHFEQQFHVRHRLDRYRAGRCMDYASSPPEVIAEALAAELKRTVDYLPVDPGGAARAAAMISELI